MPKRRLSHPQIASFRTARFLSQRLGGVRQSRHELADVGAPASCPPVCSPGKRPSHSVKRPSRDAKWSSRRSKWSSSWRAFPDLPWADSRRMCKIQQGLRRRGPHRGFFHPRQVQRSDLMTASYVAAKCSFSHPIARFTKSGERFFPYVEISPNAISRCASNFNFGCWAGLQPGIDPPKFRHVFRV